MKTPPAYFASPELDVAIIQTIQQKLDSTVTWLTGRVYGKVQKGIDSTGKEYPQIWSYTDQKDSFDIRPDSDLKAYCFFEVVSSYTETDSKTRYNLNLIVWGNLDKIDSSKHYDYTQELIKEVRNRIKELYPLLDLDINSFKIFTNNEDIYDYSGILQDQIQYLIRPYTGFRINFDCLGEICFEGFVCGSGGTCIGVDILDQTGAVIHHVADGGTYSVLVESEVFDTIDSNVNEIIDPI